VSNGGAVILTGNFPIPEDRRPLLQQLVTELNREQLMFLSGYFAGAAAASPAGIPASPRLRRPLPLSSPRRPRSP
jgi:hypothetical protein